MSENIMKTMIDVPWPTFQKPTLQQENMKRILACLWNYYSLIPMNLYKDE